MAGALLLIIAEFTPLFHVHVQATGIAVKSTRTGPHHAYAMAVIGVCAAALSIAVFSGGSRPALAAVGILGVAALVIALVGDLPDATASGLVRRGGHYVQAASTASTGFYLETLGAMLLVFSSVWGFLLGAVPRREEPRSAL